MINLWYNSDEVTGFHPVVENAIKNAIINCGYDSVMELVHHPAIPNSTIIPDFAIKLKSSNRYIFVIEVKKQHVMLHRKDFKTNQGLMFLISRLTGNQIIRSIFV